MDNTLEPAEHASVVREYRAYERKQKKRQAHAIQSQNNKDRSKYYSYVKICKTYNEQNKLIEEAYFDVNGDPPRSNRVIASWSDEMYVIGAGRNSGTQSTMHYFHKYHAVGRFRRNISGFFFFRPYGLYRWNPRQRILSVAYLKPQFPLPVSPRARFVFLIDYGIMKEELPQGTPLCLALEPVISEKGNIFDGVRLYGQMPAMLNGEEDSYFFSEEGKSGVLMRISSEEAGNCVP